jgi:hypothetical protein
MRALHAATAMLLVAGPALAQPSTAPAVCEVSGEGWESESVSVHMRVLRDRECFVMTSGPRSIDPAVPTIADPPRNGTATPNIVATSYRPNPGFVGSDRFVERLVIGSTPPRTVTITVEVEVH